MIRLLSLVSVLTFTSLAALGQTASNLEVKEFKQLLDSIPGAVIIDLRTPDEIKGGIIPSAIHIDYFAKDFETKIGNLDPAKPYFLYCASGGRSGETFELLGKKGFKQVYNLKGGMTAWKKAGLPVAGGKQR